MRTDPQHPAHCPDDETLALLIEGAADSTARSFWMQHVDACELCSDVFIEVQWFVHAKRQPLRHRERSSSPPRPT